MGFNIRGGDKSSLALLSSKRGRAFARTRADEAFALPDFSDAIPTSTVEPQRQLNSVARPEQPVEHGAENVKQTMLEHESVFKEQLHELHRLYQKQCMLMAESNKDPACGQVPKPPPSGSSFLCNPENLRLQEDRSYGNASSAKVFEINDSYRALLGRMDDAKLFEDSGSSGKSSSHQLTEVYGSSKNQGRHELFDLEKPPPSHPIIDLERPADEYMDVEVQEEKPQIAGLINKAENVFAPDYGRFSQNTKPGDKRELVPVSRDLGDNKLLGFHVINDRVSDRLAGSREEILTGCLQFEGSAINHSAFNEVLPFPSRPITAPTCSKERPLLYPQKALSASRHSGCLPDLNGDYAEQPSQPTQALLIKNEEDGQCIDFEVHSRSCSSTSKLPHWLHQVPSTKAFPPRVSGQSSVFQPKDSVFFQQAQDKTKKSSYFLTQVHDKTDWPSNLPVETANVSSLYFQEPNYLWPQTSTLCFEQGEAFHRELPDASSSQFFQVAKTEGPYSGLYGRDYISEDAPFYLPQARNGERLGIPSTRSASFYPHIIGNGGPEFETHGLPVEPFSRARPEGLSISATMSPWYQHRESFSSLLQQASNPEPFCIRLPPVTSIGPWESTSTFQGPSHGMDCLERGIFGQHTNFRNAEGSSSQPNSITASPGFGNMRVDSVLGWTIGSMKESASTSWKEVETSFHKAHLPEVSSSGDHHVALNPRKILFDLNMSSEDCMLEEDFNRCNIIDSSCNANQQHIREQKREMSISSGWDNVSPIKAPFMCEPQGVQATCFGASLAAKGTVSEVPVVINATYSHNETSYLSKAADNLYSEGDMLRNDSCADYCSGEDETGGGFVGVKSSDGSGLTSCESRDRFHLELRKARDDSNTSSGEACHSLESRIPNHKEDVTFSSSFQEKRSLGLPGQMNCVSKLFMFPDTQTVHSHLDTKMEGSPYNCTEYADESEAASVVAKKGMAEASEAAELLLSLSLDLPSTIENDGASDDCRKCLDWLADIIPPEDFCQHEDMDVEIASVGKHEVKKAKEGMTEETLDGFELAVLALEPINPISECLAVQPLARGNVVDNIPTLRRRPSRRGRAGKDFQKEMLRSMSALSRHEITEDLQIIEGLIKSAAETTGSCSPAIDDKPLSSPEQLASKSFGRAKNTKSSSKLNGMLNVCSWGVSTRRKRMGRQRSQWLSLPAGVQISLFPNNAANVAS
ncbi:hypothetical protein L7F22_014081 [Adiantum nelumboides]|nr:hypothetical protein [Adiantum nelumboides]